MYLYFSNAYMMSLIIIYYFCYGLVISSFNPIHPIHPTHPN